MLNVLIVFGTRPEAIKMAPLVQELQKHPDLFNTKVCLTGQHKEMLLQVMDFFQLHYDYNLEVMKSNQNLYTLTADIITGLKSVLEKTKPDIVLVHGDTTTSLVASLAAFYYGAKIGHVEAGLRTYNKQAPFPEEINRQLTDRISDIHFAPTEESKKNLLAEGISEESIIVTGNTVIDALLESVERVNQKSSPDIEKIKQLIDFSKDIILVTGHRRENHGQGFINICNALDEISKIDNAFVIYPVHLNPNVQEPVNNILGKNNNVLLLPPLDYQTFVWLMDKSKIILTDSGGIQEEAPSLGKPVLVMRDTTERPEAVNAGTVILVGTDKEKIVTEVTHLLKDDKMYKRMSELHNPYGDGKAAQRIVEYLTKI